MYRRLDPVGQKVANSFYAGYVFLDAQDSFERGGSPGTSSDRSDYEGVKRSRFKRVLLARTPKYERYYSSARTTHVHTLFCTIQACRQSQDSPTVLYRYGTSLTNTGYQVPYVVGINLWMGQTERELNKVYAPF
jgi:hypothetical protein